MKNTRLLLITMTFLSFTVCESAMANNCPEGEILGINTKTCIQATHTCGSGCTYTVDENGTLTVNSSGVVDYSRWDTSDVNKFVLNNSTDSISYFNIGVLMGKPNLTEVILPDNIQTIHGSTSELTTSGFTQFVLPESVTRIQDGGNRLLYSDSNFTVYCTQTQINGGLCNDSVTRYERDENNNLVVYNSDNTIKGVYTDYAGITHDSVVDSYEKTDSETGTITKYNGRGILVSSTVNAPDGSVAVYDNNGHLVSKTGTTFTMKELSELVKSKGNTVSITW